MCLLHFNGCFMDNCILVRRFWLTSFNSSSDSSSRDKLYFLKVLQIHYPISVVTTNPRTCVLNLNGLTFLLVAVRRKCLSFITQEGIQHEGVCDFLVKKRNKTFSDYKIISFSVITVFLFTVGLIIDYFPITAHFVVLYSLCSDSVVLWKRLEKKASNAININ